MSACDTNAVPPGHPAVSVALTWRCQRETSSDYTVFVHCAGADGWIWAQHDSQPRNGDYPTSAWQQGQVVEDEHVLDLQGLPPGRYDVRVGMYALDTLARLSVADASGLGLQGDYAVVSEFVIEP